MRIPNLNLQSSFDNRAFSFLPDLISLRRALHQHPEISGQESWTSALLAEELTQLGLAVRTGMDGHGIVADLVTNPAAPTVALRVDMDALPIQETNEAPYRSQVPGVMHACGHDVHSAIGVGTAAVLTHLKDHLRGNVRFLFQPEEEEVTGALRMIRAGALRDPVPEAIFGLHVAPLPAGQIAWTDGLFLAGFDHFLCTLTPQESALISASQLNAIAARCVQAILRFNAWELPETWSEMQAFWDQMQAGPHALRHFIIYDASLDPENPAAWPGQFGIGIKAANPHLRRTALGRIKATLNTLCRASQTEYRLEPMGTMPDMRNDAGLVHHAVPALEAVLGKQALIKLEAAFPFNCEDFAFFTEIIPGAMFWLGAADPDQGKYALLHTPDFDVDERCLLTGTAAMAAVLVNQLANLSGYDPH